MKTLRAGPVTLLFEEAAGAVRRLSVAGHEIVRRIYPAVRDRDWNTVPARVWNVEVKDGGDTFSVDYLGRASQEEIDFAWRGSIRGAKDGTIGFRFEGQARRPFLRNRIGLCVLHPLRGCAGQPAAVETADGGQRRAPFPRYIFPNPPFTHFVRLWHSPAPGLRLRIDFEGDLFEMEDQRNWTDASFKTYSTPVALPRPVEIGPGSVVDQSVTVAIEENAPAPRPAVTNVLAVDPRPGPAFPRIGLGLARHGFQLRPPEIERLRALRPAHLRADLRPAEKGWDDVLRRAIEESRALGCPLELAVHPGETEKLRDALKAARPAVARILLFHEFTHAAKDLLAPVLPGVPIGGGSDGHFDALNARPLQKDWDFAAWPATPQVHAHDDLTLLENLEGLASQLESARLIGGERPLVVSPITLLPRAGPGSPGPRGDAPPVDSRQWSLFGAAWTLGVLKQLAEGGASAATLYETAGACGVMDRDPGPVYPLFHVLADAAELPDARVIPCRSGDPLSFDGLVLSGGGRTRILVANWSDEARRIAIPRLAAKLGIKRLNAGTIGAATATPEAWRAAPPEELANPTGRFELDLEPWEVARIDA